MDGTYRLAIEPKIKEFLLEDARYGDVTSTLIPENEQGHARIVAKQEGIACGIVEMQVLFDLLGCKLENAFNDGDGVKPGDVIATISGPLRAILLGERTALNLLMHLSGVASKTREFQQIIEKHRKNPRCKVAATRKTMPGLRIMEKRAVVIGGGDTHRWDLADMILLKDTHVAFFKDIHEMIRKYKETTSFTKKIEIEVENKESAILAARSGADIIMLDNMTFDEMASTVGALDKLGLREQVVLESSGNVDLTTLPGHAKTGVDLISTSAITLKAPTIDFSLKLVV